MMIDLTQDKERKGIIRLKGATCTSCVIGIEHMAKRLPGVKSAYVDRAAERLHVEYQGGEDTLEKICDFVYRIGYDATVVYPSSE